MTVVTSGLCLFQRVGTNYGVIDIDDGAIDWVTRDDVIQYANKVPISGVDLKNKTIKPVKCYITSNKCNWNKDGSNIFYNMKLININIVDNTGYLVTICGKKLKFRLTKEGVISFIFYNNIIVRLDDAIISILKDKHNIHFNNLV